MTLAVGPGLISFAVLVLEPNFRNTAATAQAGVHEPPPTPYWKEVPRRKPHRQHPERIFVKVGELRVEVVARQPNVDKKQFWGQPNAKGPCCPSCSLIHG